MPALGSHKTWRPEATCSGCGRAVPKNQLVVKRATFMEYGKGGRVIKTRTVAYLCRVECLDKDPDYQKPSLSAATKSEYIERIAQ